MNVLLLERHRAHLGAKQYEDKEQEPLVPHAVIGIEAEREGEIHEVKPHDQRQRGKRENPVEFIPEKDTYKIDEDMVHHDERHKPAPTREENGVDIPVYAPEGASQYCDGKHRGIDAVDAAFIPIGETLDAVTEGL